MDGNPITDAQGCMHHTRAPPKSTSCCNFSELDMYYLLKQFTLRELRFKQQLKRRQPWDSQLHTPKVPKKKVSNPYRTTKIKFWSRFA